MLLLFSHSVVSDSLQPHGLQHARLPCLSRMGMQMYGHFGNQFGNFLSSSTYTCTQNNTPTQRYFPK